MTMLFSAVAFAAAQAATAAPVDHSQHSAAQHAQHQQGQQQAPGTRRAGEQDCCKQVDGKMECPMMKGDGADTAHGQHQGHSGH